MKDFDDEAKDLVQRDDFLQDMYPVWTKMMSDKRNDAGFGGPKAKFMLRYSAAHGMNDQETFEEGFQNLINACYENNGDALLMVAVLYDEQRGLTRSQDVKQVYKLFTLSHLQGQPIASAMLAWLYENGSGVEDNPIMAFRLYTEASEKGINAAIHNLAQMYWRGAGVTQDPKKGTELMLRAATIGYAESEYLIGLTYLDGSDEIGPVDLKKAAYWLGRSAYRGHSKAKSEFASLYASGLGVPNDVARAIMWRSKTTPRHPFNSLDDL